MVNLNLNVLQTRISCKTKRETPYIDYLLQWQFPIKNTTPNVDYILCTWIKILLRTWLESTSNNFNVRVYDSPINEWLNEWMNEWMNEWFPRTSTISYCGSVGHIQNRCMHLVGNSEILAINHSHLGSGIQSNRNQLPMWAVFTLRDKHITASPQVERWKDLVTGGLTWRMCIFFVDLQETKNVALKLLTTLWFWGFLKTNISPHQNKKALFEDDDFHSFPPNGNLVSRSLEGSQPTPLM